MTDSELRQWYGFAWRLARMATENRDWQSEVAQAIVASMATTEWTRQAARRAARSTIRDLHAGGITGTQRGWVRTHDLRLSRHATTEDVGRFQPNPRSRQLLAIDASCCPIAERVNEDGEQPIVEFIGRLRCYDATSAALCEWIVSHTSDSIRKASRQIGKSESALRKAKKRIALALGYHLICRRLQHDGQSLPDMRPVDTWSRETSSRVGAYVMPDLPAWWETKQPKPTPKPTPQPTPHTSRPATQPKPKQRMLPISPAIIAAYQQQLLDEYRSSVGPRTDNIITPR